MHEATNGLDTLFKWTSPWQDPEAEAEPYADGTYGAGGSEASAERAHREVEDGTASARQRQTLRALARAEGDGLTWWELGNIMGWHHGQSSGVLSVLHKDERISRLTEQRGRSSVYVLTMYVAGRDTRAHRSNRPTGENHE
jgi:hypothetical protein